MPVDAAGAAGKKRFARRAMRRAGAPIVPRAAPLAPGQPGGDRDG